MTEAEFMELARKKWAELQKVKDSKSLYELEERFDEVVGDMNRQLLESVLGEVPKDHRKKKSAHQVRPHRDSQ
jgi:hypothetical protein